MKLRNHLLLNVFLLLSVLVVLAPFIWMLTVSMSPSSDPFRRIAFLIPTSVSLDGYLQVFRQAPVARWFMNSVLLTSILTAGQLLLGVLAAYAFARYQFRGREALFFFVLCTMMIPPQAIMLPVYLVVNSFDWVNSYKGVIIPHIASAYAIFVLRQFFMAIPRELEEASRVDGCQSVQTLYHIYLRASVPTLFGVGLIQFVNNWNDYYWPFLILSDGMKMTLPVAIVHFRNDSYIEWVPTMAAATLSILPVIGIYVLAQRYFTESSLHSGIK